MIGPAGAGPFFSFAGAFSPAPRALPRFQMTSHHLERLPNGFTTVAIEVPARHRVLVSLLVRAGSRFEAPAASGLSHFLEHMIFRGNAVHPDARRISIAFERVGSQPNACTGVESTEFYFLSHPGRLAEGLEALAALVQTPTFPEVEKERGIVLDEILYDYNEQGELIQLGSLAAGLLWPEHPLGQSVLGTRATVATFDEALLRTHHARHYGPEQMVLGLAGNVSPADACALAGRFFGDLPRSGEAPPAALIEGPHEGRGASVKMVPDADNQFHLQLSFPARGYNSEDEIPLSLLARLLDDGPTTLLQRRIREDLGLAYHVAAEYSGFQDVGQFDIATSVQAERLPELLAVLVDSLVDFRDRGPLDEELARAKARHRLELEFSRDSLEAQLERFAWPLLYSEPREIAEEIERVEALTVEGLRAQARRLFQGSQLHLALVGPLNTAMEKAVWQAVGRL